MHKLPIQLLDKFVGKQTELTQNSTNLLLGVAAF